MSGAPLLEVVGVSKHFGGLRALDGVSMRVVPGSVTGIVGPNGAGKTTLFNVISGTYRPDEGSIHLRGTEVTGLRPHQMAQAGVARTFQITRPFAGLTVLEAVRIGALLRQPDLAAATRDAAAILERVGLSGLAGTMGRDLTVMQRKSVEVARALATQPAVILLDEVAAGLRPGEIREMIALVRALAAEGIAVVLIEHVLEAVMAVSERILVLHHGRKISEGTPREVTRDPAVVDAYFGEVWQGA
jgi:branched-chain amino acid transport system ATP-binding protein